MRFNTETLGAYKFLRLKRIARFGYGDTLTADGREEGEIQVYGSNGPFDNHSKANTFGPVIVIGRKGACGKLNFSNDPVFAVDTTFIIDKRHTKANLKFLYYSLGVMGLDELSDDSVVPGLSREKAYRSLMPHQPIETQHLIADFLDHKTILIDRLIKKKQKKIKLLDEYKQAIIHQAVTGRIDVRTGQPYPDYKPSGIEWLGDVPEHWEVFRLGQIGRFFKGNGGTKADESKDGIPCIRYGDIYTQYQFFITESRSYVAANLWPEYTPIKYGDVLFAASGETMEDIGKSAVNLMYGSACCGGDVIVLRLFIDMNLRYIGYAADCPASIRQKSLMGRGFTVVHIYHSKLKYLVIAVPPVSEQTAIADFLDNTLANIVKITDHTKRQIELIREYRNRLIADAVTGRIDVREAAEGLRQTNSVTCDDEAISTPSEQHY